MNPGPKRKSGESYSHKCILYSKPTFFCFGFRVGWSTCIETIPGSVWPLCSHIPCSSSLLIFFLAFSFLFPITVSPHLTSLLTLAGLEKNWKTFKQLHYLRSYPTAAGSALKLPLDIKHVRQTSVGNPTTDVPFFTPPRSENLQTKSATPKILSKYLIVLVVHQACHMPTLSSLIASPIPWKW